MSLVELIFYFFGGITVLSAILILLNRNVLYNAFFLLISFLSVAALYVFAGADFIAVTQIMIYVGGILVLLIYGVMFTNRAQSKQGIFVGQRNVFFGAMIGLLLFSLLTFAITDSSSLTSMNNAVQPSSTVSTLGVGLMTTYLIPFELAAILLLVALIGASLIAWRGSQTVQKKGPSPNNS